MFCCRWMQKMLFSVPKHMSLHFVIVHFVHYLLFYSSIYFEAAIWSKTWLYATTNAPELRTFQNFWLYALIFEAIMSCIAWMWSMGCFWDSGDFFLYDVLNLREFSLSFFFLLFSRRALACPDTNTQCIQLLLSRLRLQKILLHTFSFDLVDCQYLQRASHNTSLFSGNVQNK